MKKIAVIGGSYLQLPAVRKAHEMGLEVHCFSWADGAVCAAEADYFYDISIVEKEQILVKCEEIGIDGVVSIASDVAVLTVNYVAQKMHLTGNDDAFSKSMTDKYLMRECFKANDIPSPGYVQFSEGDSLAALESTLTFPVIVKPTDRSGSLGVTKVSDSSELEASVTRATAAAFSRKAIIEEFVDGREVSVESISWKGKHHVLQITDKVTTGAPYFVELEHHQPSTLSTAVKDEIKAIVSRSLTALHIEFGASHAELKITATGEIRVIEIGARMGGDFIGSHLVSLSTGYDYLRGVIEIALGQFVEPKCSRDKCAGVYFLSEETAWLKPIFEHSDDRSDLVEAALTSSELRPIRCSGDRSGYLIYCSNEKLSLKPCER